MKKIIVGIFVFMLIIATTLPAIGNINQQLNKKNKFLYEKTKNDYVPGEFIVKFTRDSDLLSSSTKALNDKYHIKSIQKIFKRAEGTILDNIYLLIVPEDSNILSIIKDYVSCTDVIYAEPNYNGELPLIPDDEYFIFQWNLNNSGQFGGTPDADIDATDAWNITTGNPSIIIASVDTGVDYTHPDLSDRIWENEDEIPGNGFDDDGNGFIDDTCGWDFCENDNEPLDREGHGTYCAGIHGAVTNNLIGIAGVDWNSKTMVLRCYNRTSWQESWYAQGIVYAADNGADIINIEICYSSYPYLIEDVVNYAYGKGAYLLAPAGNWNESSPRYPAGFDNVTAVGATNQFDERCDEDDWGPGKGSNWGNGLDIAAPGQWIGSTTPTYPDYERYPQMPMYYCQPGESGTSAAAPHVAGVAALLLSVNPSLNADELKSLICDNVDPYNSTYYIGTGRINAYKALMALYGKIYCEGNLVWNDVKAGSTVTGSFFIKNNGGNGSLLDWGISKKPVWGDWSITPSSGNNLETGVPLIINVIVKAPLKKNMDYEGEIIIKNKNNPDDFCTLDVSMSVPRNKPFDSQFNFFRWLFENFPNTFPLLRYILGLSYSKLFV